MKCVGRNTIISTFLQSLVILIICAQIIPFCAFAQCGDCDDNNPCTRDYCNGTKCLHEPIPCSDVQRPEDRSVQPNDTERTQEMPRIEQRLEKEPPASPPPVSEPSAPTPPKTPPPEDGGSIPRSPGIADENPSTADPCSAGDCVSEPSSDTVGRSGPSIGRESSPAAELPSPSVDCNDGNPCTEDRWDGTTCVHLPIDCDDGDPCTVDSCGSEGCIHESSAGCEDGRHPAPASRSPDADSQMGTSFDCDDDNPCTEDRWDGTTCVHVPVDCDDGNFSTLDSCGPGGCVHTPAIEDTGTDAKDGGSESCETCTSKLHPDENSLNETASERTLSVGNGSSQQLCDDGDPCTVDEYDGANCISTPITCDDGNSSTRDFCESGVCINEPLGGEIADNATAAVSQLSLSPRSCDDGDACTIDVFNGTGCEHVPVNCDDGNPATFDYCYGGTCFHTPTNCDDGDPCTVDTYNGTACVNIPRNCNDSDPCTVDYCQDGVCKHAPKSCDDGNACTLDYCDCGVCRHTPTSCDDGNRCTVDSCDPARGCIHTKKSCDDNNPCTIDSCSPERGCVHTAKNCDDGNACTIDTCDRRGRCVHLARNCNDGDPCTLDECDPYWGCIHTPICRDRRTYYDTPFYSAPRLVPSQSAAPRSYMIPVGSSINLPWGKAVTALVPVKVENGVAYSTRLPIRFSRLMGYDQAASIDLDASPPMDRVEMVGLTWQGNPFSVTLIRPDGKAVSPDSDKRNIRHVTGPNYDYYFLRNPARGRWMIEIRPINPGSRGQDFSLITGLVGGTDYVDWPN